jgi:hypothetical protein
MKPIVFIAILLLAFTSGCDKIDSMNSQKEFGKYQFVTSPAGEAFVLNSETGKIVRITKEGLDVLTENVAVLRVGAYYKPEDSKIYVKYLGNEKLEPSQYAVRKSDPK